MFHLWFPLVHWFTASMPAIVRAEPGWIQEPRTPLDFHVSGRGPSLDHYLLPSQGHLEFRPALWCGMWAPKCGLMRSATHWPQQFCVNGVHRYMLLVRREKWNSSILVLVKGLIILIVSLKIFSLNSIFLPMFWKDKSKNQNLQSVVQENIFLLSNEVWRILLVIN